MAQHAPFVAVERNVIRLRRIRDHRTQGTLDRTEALTDIHRVRLVGPLTDFRVVLLRSPATLRQPHPTIFGNELDAGFFESLLDRHPNVI
jgi:hypothetical protein